MHIVVCIKQVLDPDIPARSFRVDRAARRPDVPGAARVMSIFDANALEVALKLREACGGGTVTALSLGERSAEDVLRKALAVTADRAVLISDPAFSELDAAGKARVLAAAIRCLDPPADVVLCGRQAADWENGQVGSMLAEALGWPCLTFVSRIAPQDGGLLVRREVDKGYELYRAQPPLVCTVTNDPTNVLRLAKVRDMMAAGRKPVPVWSAADLGLDPGALARRVEVVDLFVPERASGCAFIDGPTPAEKAAALARRLRELNLI